MPVANNWVRSSNCDMGNWVAILGGNSGGQIVTESYAVGEVICDPGQPVADEVSSDGAILALAVIGFRRTSFLGFELSSQEREAGI
jgi:hypothetical protein